MVITILKIQVQPLLFLSLTFIFFLTLFCPPQQHCLLLLIISTTFPLLLKKFHLHLYSSSNSSSSFVCEPGRHRCCHLHLSCHCCSSKRQHYWRQRVMQEVVFCETISWLLWWWLLDLKWFSCRKKKYIFFFFVIIVRKMKIGLFILKIHSDIKLTPTKAKINVM